MIVDEVDMAIKLGMPTFYETLKSEKLKTFEIVFISIIQPMN